MLTAVLLGACGINAGLRSEKPGAGNLNFYHVVPGGPFAPPTQQLFLTKYLPQPFFGWFFTDSELVASAPADDLRIIDLDPTQLALDYRATHQNWWA